VTMIGGPSSGTACVAACSGAVRCDWVPQTAVSASPRRSYSVLPRFRKM
jgi:hypothetical protein